MEVVQYIGGCSVHRGHNISTVGDSFSTVEVVQYSGDNISTCGGITSVLWRDIFSTVGDNSSTCGGIASVLWGIPSVLWGIPSVLWRLFSTVGDNISTVGDNISTVGDSVSTVEGIQYIGG